MSNLSPLPRCCLQSKKKRKVKTPCGKNPFSLFLAFAFRWTSFSPVIIYGSLVQLQHQQTSTVLMLEIKQDNCLVRSSGLLAGIIHAVSWTTNFIHTRTRHGYTRALCVPVPEVCFETRMKEMCMWKDWHPLDHAQIWSQEVGVQCNNSFGPPQIFISWCMKTCSTKSYEALQSVLLEHPKPSSCMYFSLSSRFFHS